MPTKKKPTKKVEPAPEEQTSDDPTYSSDRGAGFGTNLKDMMSKETQMHLFKGITEMALAMESMIPRSQMPEEAKRHARAIKREMLKFSPRATGLSMTLLEKPGLSVTLLSR